MIRRQVRNEVEFHICVKISYLSAYCSCVAKNRKITLTYFFVSIRSLQTIIGKMYSSDKLVIETQSTK